MTSYYIKFVLQLSTLNMSQTSFSADYSKFVLIFLFLNKNLETLFQINFTDDFACTMDTHPEVSGGAHLGRKPYISSFQKTPHIQTQPTVLSASAYPYTTRQPCRVLKKR
jgi:hypothetical protein